MENFSAQHLKDGGCVKLPIPKCYFTHYTPKNHELMTGSALVLENLKIKGFDGIEFSRGLTLRQSTAAVQAIAQIHGTSLAMKVKEGIMLSDRYSFLFKATNASDSYQQLVDRGLPDLFQFLEGIEDTENILKALDTIRPKTKEIIEDLLTPVEPMALLTHTDFWCNNLLFKEDKAQCVCFILDWQMVTYSRPTNDLALLLVSSVPAELRRSHTDTLLDIYWQSITTICNRLGVDVEKELGYDRKQLGEDYRRSLLLALLLCIGSVDVALGNPLTEKRLLELLRDLYSDRILQYDMIIATNQ